MNIVEDLNFGLGLRILCIILLIPTDLVLTPEVRAHKASTN